MTVRTPEVLRLPEKNSGAAGAPEEEKRVESTWPESWTWVPLPPKAALTPVNSTVSPAATRELARTTGALAE